MRLGVANSLRFGCIHLALCALRVSDNWIGSFALRFGLKYAIDAIDVCNANTEAKEVDWSAICSRNCMLWRRFDTFLFLSQEAFPAMRFKIEKNQMSAP